MKESIKFVEEYLSTLFKEFPKSNFRYEFRANSNLHLIEVTPLNFYEDEHYMQMETNFENEFEQLFPKENLLFISDGSLNVIKCARIELLAEREFEVDNLNSSISAALDMYQSEEFLYEIAEENNYALAA